MHVRRDELHQVLVGGDDGDISADGLCLAGIGGNDVVGLEAFGLDAGQVEGAGRMTDQSELRNEIFRRGRTVRLVERIDFLAECRRRIVEDHGQMGRRDPDIGVAGIAQQLPQHVAETGDRVDGQTVRLAVQGRDGVESTENETRAVDEEEMIAFFHVGMDSAGQSKRP